MTLEQLFAIGVTSCGGQLDYRNQNIGFIAGGEAVLNQNGEILLANSMLSPVTPTKPRAPRSRVVSAAGSVTVDLTPEQE